MPDYTYDIMTDKEKQVLKEVKQLPEVWEE